MISRQVEISAVIPAYNEGERISEVIRKAQEVVGQVIVADDGSTDRTEEVAARLGAEVVANRHKKGYIGAIKTGFEKARGDIVVTLDADGEHDPSYIPRLTQPIFEQKADLVLGKREKIPRISERFINWLANLKVNVADSGTGFRAMNTELALKLKLTGKCTCGILVLEASHHGARITEVPVALNYIPKGRKIAWSHFWQIFFVLRLLLFSRLPRRGQEDHEYHFGAA
jgi:glycosyltransferase involved in cell wall biosynthesis